MTREDCKIWTEDLLESLQTILQTLGLTSVAPTDPGVGVGSAETPTVQASKIVMTHQWQGVKPKAPTEVTAIYTGLQSLCKNLQKFTSLLDDSNLTAIDTDALLKKRVAEAEACYASLQGNVEIIDNHLRRLLRNNGIATLSGAKDILFFTEKTKNFLQAYDRKFFIDPKTVFTSANIHFKEILDDLEETYPNTPDSRKKGSLYEIAFSQIQKYIEYSQLIAEKNSATSFAAREDASEKLTVNLRHHNNYKGFKDKSRDEVMHETVGNTIMQYLYIYKQVKQLSTQRKDVMLKFFNAHTLLCLEGTTELSDWAARFLLLNEISVIEDIIMDPRYTPDRIIKFIKGYDRDQIMKFSKNLNSTPGDEKRLTEIYMIFERHLATKLSTESQRVADAKTNDEKLAILCEGISETIIHNKVPHEVNKSAREIVRAYLFSIDYIDEDKPKVDNDKPKAANK